MNEKLKIKKTKRDGKLLVEFEGSIDEDASFEDIPFDSESEYFFDFNKLKAINTCGAREWISFLKKIDNNIKITYQRCPRILIEHMHRVKGFIKTGARVKSFYAPYYCKEKDIEKIILLQDTDIKNDRPPAIKNNHGDEMDFDASWELYFNFLKQPRRDS